MERSIDETEAKIAGLKEQTKEILPLLSACVAKQEDIVAQMKSSLEKHPSYDGDLFRKTIEWVFKENKLPDVIKARNFIQSVESESGQHGA
jgi:hypothetical protein